jgi:2-polyprenyl-6-hydroxyphenyl methylase/3-demethylubiquinone-9 3-methyltransferase
MDLLEHVPSYQKALEEASRVLKKGGLLFFHTFNRNLVSHIVIIKGVEWFVKNTPKNLHVYSFFIKPKELGSVLENQGLKIETLKGLIPDAKSLGFWRMLFKKELKEDFRFKFSKSLLTGYVGMAKK